MWYALLNTYYLARPHRRPAIDPLITSEMSMRVLPHHLDALRHMNNSVYPTLAEAGRFDHLVRSGYSTTVRKQRWYAVVTAQTMTYRRSLRAGQRFTLQTRLAGVQDRDVIFEHLFVRDGVVCARVVAALRVLRRSGGSITRDELLQAFPALTAVGDPPEWVRQWHTTAVPLEPAGPTS